MTHRPTHPAKHAARRIVVTSFMSLDGVVEDPAWTFPYWNEETAAFKAAETDRGQELLLGRVTYEQFAQAWPQRKDDDPGAAYFNPARKHVVSATRTQDVWQNATFVHGGDLRKEIEKLKAEPGPDLVVHGSVTLARWLLAEGLVDELRLLVYPIAVGKGRRLLDGGLQATLDLVSSRATSKGVLALVYRRAARKEG
jgi:dihydrofolate reductase